MTADQIRAAMGEEFCAVADALRAQFDAKLVFLEVGTVRIGMPPAGEPIGEKHFLAKRSTR